MDFSRNIGLLICTILIVILISFVLLPSLQFLYVQEPVEGFSDPTYQYATKTREGDEPAPFWYELITPTDGREPFFRSIFPLQYIPVDDQVPYGYAKTGSFTEDGLQVYIVPTTTDTIYAEMKKLSTATIGNSENSEETREMIEKVEEMQKDYTDNYYNSVEYHDDEETIRNRAREDGRGIAYVVDKDGDRVGLGKVPDSQAPQLYYTAGAYPFGSATYVPNHEDSVYLSTLTGETMATPLEDTAAMQGGFCTQEAHNPLKIDEMCRSMDKNKCASTSCCVLLGGAKCVGGKSGGPTMTGHYSDVTIRNRDFYYYQGKCYGNCPQHNPF